MLYTPNLSVKANSENDHENDDFPTGKEDGREVTQIVSGTKEPKDL